MKLHHLLFIAPFILFATGCGNGAGTAGQTTGGSVDCTDPSCTSGTFAVKPQKVEAVISQRQVLPSFQKCVGLANNQISATTKAAFKDAQSSFSLEGQVKDIHAPMMMALTKVASELCTDLINVEKNSTSRKYFPGFTLGGTTANTQAFNLSATVSTLANACWGRSPTAPEISTIQTGIGALKDSSAALFACTAILSSAQAIRY